MHSPEALDDDFNIIEIELKTPGTGEPINASLDPLKVDPGHYKLEFENPQVRVLRVRIPAPRSGSHALAFDGSRNRLSHRPELSYQRPYGQGQAVEHKAGDVAWGTPIEHTEQNLSDQPFEAVTVEIKR